MDANGSNARYPQERQDQGAAGGGRKLVAAAVQLSNTNGLLIAAKRMVWMPEVTRVCVDIVKKACCCAGYGGGDGRRNVSVCTKYTTFWRRV